MAIIRCRQCWWPADEGVKTCPKCGARIRKPVPVLPIALACLLIAVGLITYHRSEPPERAGPSRPPDPAAAARAEAISKLDFSYTWTKGRPGSTMVIAVTVINKGARDVKDLLVACEHRSLAGKLLDTNQGIAWGIAVEASGTRHIDRLEMGPLRVEPEETSCYVKNLAVGGA